MTADNRIIIPSLTSSHLLICRGVGNMKTKHHYGTHASGLTPEHKLHCLIQGKKQSPNLSYH